MSNDLPPAPIVTLNDDPHTAADAAQAMRPARAPTPAPTQVATAAAAETVDALGRRLVIRELTALEQLDLIEACGNNPDRYIGMAILAASVRFIDGDHTDFPRTKLQLRALVQRVGKEGIEAAATALQRQAGEPSLDVGTAKN